jgi:oxaloacetate decarboxylase alpha subunit
VRKKYHAFEGQLKGYDSRILVAQVPGGMLTNLESQLKQQNAAHRLDEVLAEIPACARTSVYPAGDPDLADCRHPGGAQRVDRRALQNHRQRDRRYSERRIRPHPAPVNAALQAKVLDGAQAITCRPADLLKPELAALEADVKRQAQEKGITLAETPSTTC